MGYSFSVYAVDLDKLTAVAGKNDRKLLAAVLKKQAEEIADNDESFEEEIAKGTPSLAVALQQIIEGKIKAPKGSGYQYGYALEVLCAHLGERIEEEDLSWFHEFIDGYLKKVKSRSSMKLLGEDKLPIRIPKPDDFPGIGSITLEQVIAATPFFTAAAKLATDDDDATEVFDEIVGWLKVAKKKKRGLVWFVY